MLTPLFRWRLFLLLLISLSGALSTRAAETGVPVEYRLPATPGQTYQVTLAVVDPKNPDSIISQFASGVIRTVTAENGGRFSERWDGLDDNFMPVPPGSYALRGIYMPAHLWPVDGEWHSITPRFHSGASPWLPSPEEWRTPQPFGGDPVGAPLADVAVGANGVSVFYYQYLENGQNNPLIDLKKPLGLGQFQRAFPSGGAGGGPCATTDGETVWAFSTDGGPKFVYRADGKSWGHAEGANRPNSYAPEGWVTAMAVWHERSSAPAVVFVAQRGKIVKKGQENEHESETDFVDKVTFHDGVNGTILGESPLPRPQGLAVWGDNLYALHAAGEGLAVSEADLLNGQPGKWNRLFAVPTGTHASDLEVDSHGRIYLSDSAANHVYQYDRAGHLLHTFGRLAAQRPGTWDPQTFIAPGKLATWSTPEGDDHLLVVENGGPNRTTEWTAEGEYVREFLSLQTHANDGYGFDPEHPEMVYLPGQQNWLTRFRVDYEAHTWTIDAVWPDVGPNPSSGPLDRLQLLRRGGQLYLAGRRSFDLYRLEGDRWLLSAAILRQREAGNHAARKVGLWHDTNGNGVIDEESTVVELPQGILTYHGQRWLDDLSLIAPGQGTRDVWRLGPSGFDMHGNPIYEGFAKVLTDPVFTARAEGKADALHGGNELANDYASDWMGADGSMETGFWVQARGGKNFSANEGPQHKISHYVPDGQGGYRLQWRTGRSALRTLARPGEMYGAMRIQRPIGGLVSVVDQSRCGILLYTEDGLYVDTLFPDEHRFSPKVAGMYPQPGEFFAGEVVPNKTNKKIYLAMGKYTPLLYEAEGWSLKGNPVQRLTTLPASIAITSAQIASPPEIALSVRGGAGTAKVARFAPALGTVALDGSMTGWESCSPIVFQAEAVEGTPKQKDAAARTVEVRALYRPEALLLRWHVRLGTTFEAKLLPPSARIFTHDQLADTVSFYLQGDPQAPPSTTTGGRPGDARFVFGIFKDEAGVEQPVGVGLYPTWAGTKGQPQVYRTPVGEVAFAHVGRLAGAKLGHVIDEDGKGFVLVAELPRAALPLRQAELSASWRTQVNFEATLGGHQKFWWANTDGSASRETYDEPTEARLYPGSWAPAEFQGFAEGVTIRHWLACGPFGGPGAEAFREDPNGTLRGTTTPMKEAVQNFYQAATYPPDARPIDFTARYAGSETEGYWPKPGPVAWKPATVADLDTRIALGGGAQVWYGATWVHVPEATELEFQFQEGHQSTMRWTLNDEAVQPGQSKPGKNPNVLTATTKLTLQAGWNRVAFRGFCVGYPPFRAGLVLQGVPEKLWTLQLADSPPKE